MKLFISLCIFCFTTISYAADDYMQALEAEAAELDSSDNSIHVTPSKNYEEYAPLITQEVRDAFEQQLKSNYRASFYTFAKLNASHRDKVIAFYLANGKSMKNISIKLLEQYSQQVKNQ